MSDLFDNARGLLAENSDAVDALVDQLAGLVDEKTGGQHKAQVRKGAAKAKDAIAQLAGDGAEDSTAGGRKPERATPKPRVPKDDAPDADRA